MADPPAAIGGGKTKGAAGKRGGGVTPLDIFFMTKALRLAKHGSGKVHPNPLVGAVVVKNGKIVGEGAHERFGGPHAEVNAISKAKSSAHGAALYITLEPCAHYGKTPPCVDLILKNKIAKVVIGAKDPNPLVSGKGIRILKRAGIRVMTGVLEKKTTELNRDFNHWMRNKAPYVIVKIAQSLDGKIATHTGQSRWITQKAARVLSHELRAASDAILVGVNTVAKDNPLLNVRYGAGAARPVRIILDSHLRVSPRARIFSDRSGGPVIVAVTKKANRRRWEAFRGKAEILPVKEKNGKVDLRALMKVLGKRGIVRLLIEGGGEVVGSAFAQKVVNEVYFFVAPMIIGGKRSIASVGGPEIASLKNAVKIKNFKAFFAGKDLLIRGTL